MAYPLKRYINRVLYIDYIALAIVFLGGIAIDPFLGRDLTWETAVVRAFEASSTARVSGH